MNWLWVATVAQIILGSSVVFDKLLLAKRSIEPWAYTFWLGIFGALAVVLLPFGFQGTDQATVILAMISGILFIGASLALFAALEITEVSEALPIMGALVPIFTLGLAALILGSGLGRLDFIGFAMLVLSGLLLALVERASRRWKTIILSLAASLLAAGSTVTAKVVFNQTNFITGFFWIKVGGILAVLAFLLVPHIRKRILAESAHTAVRSRLAYFMNRGYAGLGSLLTSFAISLGSPALVEATANFRYLVIFALGALILHERFRGRVLAAKLAAASLIIVGLAALAGGEYVRRLPSIDPNRPISWGVTFSAKFSREIGLDWQASYQAILNELKPRRLRLIAYWDEIEPEDNAFSFDDLDWQIMEAEERAIPYILAVGAKTPRWPECHLPDWAAALPAQEQEAALNDYISAIVERYQHRPFLMLWQVENEPFLWFGECPVQSRESLEREVSLVRLLDPRRPILTTDGGEFGLWAPVARFGDVFGTTMYRKAYPRFIGPLFGVIEYPIAPAYFRVKERIVRWWNATPEQRFLVIELQGEPWEPRSLAGIPAEELVSAFSPEYFRDTIEYAKAAGFEEYYLWGAEWWYYMKEKYDDARYWEIVRSLFRHPER